MLTGEFEKRCAVRTSKETVLGVKVQYNLDGGFMDDSQKQPRKPGMRTAIIVDVLYADNCVLFTSTISAMQIIRRCGHTIRDGTSNQQDQDSM